MNSRRIGTTFVLATLFAAPALLAQSQFKFKEVVRTGDAAPVPPQLGSVLEFAFSDQGNVALIADGGLILKSGTTVIPIAGQAIPRREAACFSPLPSRHSVLRDKWRSLPALHFPAPPAFIFSRTAPSLN